jgi:predicted SprT family Zn-dependent metalloprotease
MDLAKKLDKYLPDGATPIILTWLQVAPIQIKVSKPRQSKLGDYSPASPADPVHRITVNGDLNQYAFLVTLVHEFAHFTAYQRTTWEIKPHGREWQYEYHRIMQPFLDRGIFPFDVHMALEQHLLSAPASSCNDRDLMRVLRKYDKGAPKIHVEELPFRAIFKLGQKTFEKGRKLRKRYSCRCLEDKREYYVDALAEVLPCPAVNT